MNIRQSYREAAVQGASPVQLAIRLYEQLIDDLRRVSAAIENNDIRMRTDRIRHAILVVGHLQSSLDFAQGERVAKNLDTFYNDLRQRIVVVQFNPSKRGVGSLVTDLLAVREAWIEVDRVESSKRSVARSPDMSGSPFGDTDSDQLQVDWQG